MTRPAACAISLQVDRRGTDLDTRNEDRDRIILVVEGCDCLFALLLFILGSDTKHVEAENKHKDFHKPCR